MEIFNVKPLRFVPQKSFRYHTGTVREGRAHFLVLVLKPRHLFQIDLSSIPKSLVSKDSTRSAEVLRLFWTQCCCPHLFSTFTSPFRMTHRKRAATRLMAVSAKGGLGGWICFNDKDESKPLRCAFFQYSIHLCLKLLN